METNFSTCSFAPVFPYNPEQQRKKPQLPQSPSGFPPLREGWLAEFETFASADDPKIRLFGQIFRPQKWKGENAHRALFVLHGHGEHGGRYVHFPFYLGDTVSAVYALDHRGHGQSRGIRGHVDSFDQYAADAALAINRFYEYLLEKFGKAEIHLCGHSMGGQIALQTVLQHHDLPISSLTVSAPLFDMAFPVPKVKKMASRILHKLAPRLTMHGTDLSNLVCSDPQVCQHYRNDSLNHDLVSASWFMSYLEAKESAISRAGEIEVPLLVQVAMDDRIVQPGSIVKFFDKLKHEDKNLVRYDHFYHEIYNEPERERAFDDLKDWINRHHES